MTNPDELPLKWFHDLQLKKLSTKKNVAKAHWIDLTEAQLLKRIKDEYKELLRAMVTNANADSIIDECVDVANFCVMLAHKLQMERQNGEPQK